MHRPFFSLTILLKIIAASLLFISSAYSQTGVVAFDSASAAVHGCGWIWHAESGWAIRSNFVEVHRALQNRSYVLRPENNLHRSLPWTVADNEPVTSPDFVSTGYDSAYDFAMFDGRYDDVAQSTVDIGGCVSESASETELAPVFAITCPAPSLYFDDYDCCLDSGFHRGINEDLHQQFSPATESAWGDCEADGFVEADASLDDSLDMCDSQLALDYIQAALQQTIDSAVAVWQCYLAPFAQPQQITLSEAEAKLAWEQLTRAATHTVEVVEIAVDSSWRPFAYHSLVIETQSLSINDFNWQKPVFPVASTISLSEGQQIVILAQAAATLDEIGLYLQEAAQQLRYIAADRIVSKGSNRRIAREGNR
jgi:hypothetical protein